MTFLNETGLQQSISARRRNWLVTGAAGFIGSHLVEQLLGLGQSVVAVDNLTSGKKANLDGLGDAPTRSRQDGRLRFVEGDIRDPDTCAEVCRDIDCVLHQAGFSSVAGSFDNPAETHAINVTGSLNLLWASRQAGVRRFVYASSSAVYGDHPAIPNYEECIGRPLSPYAVSKYVAELYARNFYHSHGLETVGLRYFNIYGPRQDAESDDAAIIPRFSRALLRGLPVTIFGDGRASRDFCHVDNVVQANLRAALCDNRRVFGEVFNVSCAQEVGVLKVFGLMRDILSSRYPGIEIREPVYRRSRAGDIRRSRGDLSRIGKALGYAPSRLLTAGLPSTLHWYRENLQVA